jgi:hypothetical protein
MLDHIGLQVQDVEASGYYSVFLRDLDGHNVEAVHHG